MGWPSHAMQSPPEGLTCQYLTGNDTLGWRSVSDAILPSVLDIPMPSAKLRADWAREIAVHLELQAGDVQPLPLARTRLRWPAFAQCVKAAADWTQQAGLGEVLNESDMALMACRGARYHHDAAQYGGSAFCNLFLTDDQGLDLHFPATDQRIPLVRGTVVIFDTGQPHAVIQRGSNGFSAADFVQDPSCAQVFATWELSIEDPRVAQALQIIFAAGAGPAAQAEEHALWHCGKPVHVCPDSGGWQSAVSFDKK